MQIKPKKQDAYEEKHRTELALYQAAERYLKEKLGKGGSIKMKTWKMEIATLTSEKEHLYREVNKLKIKEKEVETVKKCVENIFADMAIPTEQARAKSPSHRKDMEL